MPAQLATIHQTLRSLPVEMVAAVEMAMGLAMAVLAGTQVALLLRRRRQRAAVAVHRQMPQPREATVAMVAMVASAVMVATEVAQVPWRRSQQATPAECRLMPQLREAEVATVLLVATVARQLRTHMRLTTSARSAFKATLPVVMLGAA